METLINTKFNFYVTHNGIISPYGKEENINLTKATNYILEFQTKLLVTSSKKRIKKILENAQPNIPKNFGKKDSWTGIWLEKSLNSSLSFWASSFLILLA